ncbi:hypothetical protein R1flu_022608 [Riccia fluitans]|uniref:Reverse transcriptase RNase H-like domain-containing protein n=1 Tax=Riccia fluitans TaxID=41844 RepID=A0ABD1XSP4_9MARC
MKAERNYLIGAEVIVETDCLPLLGMITNCSTPDITMLNWIAYSKSVNPEFKHIAGKENVVADMLSRTWYDGEEEMIEEYEDVGEEFYFVIEVGVNSGVGFREDLYEDEWLDIGRYLQKLCRDTQLKLMAEFHESLWAGHRGMWTTYNKLKWVIDLVTMLVGLWGMRYLVLVREDLSNQVEGRDFKTKAIEGICRFLLEDVIFKYGCVGKVTASRGKLDVAEAKEIFQREMGKDFKRRNGEAEFKGIPDEGKEDLEDKVT